MGLSLFACLLLFSLQSYQPIKALFESQAVFTQLTNLIHYARSEAIRTGNQVIICKSRDRKTCSGNWSDGQIVFINPEKPHLLMALGPVKMGTLTFHAFQSSDFLRFTPKGNTFEQNGSFVYCPNENPRLAHALIIEKSGQIRLSHDDNHDGVDEDPNGMPLSCPTLRN